MALNPFSWTMSTERSGFIQYPEMASTSLADANHNLIFAFQSPWRLCEEWRGHFKQASSLRKTTE